jgi:CheY-like chemotaxis protein
MSDVSDDDFDAAFTAWRRELRESRPLRILLVDDNDNARESIAMLLRHDGHEVVAEARDGQAGVADAARLRPDVVITDCRMPTLDGVEATRRIRANAPAPEVIAFCSTGGDETADAFIEAGAHASIDKRDIARLRSVLRGLSLGR